MFRNLPWQPWVLVCWPPRTIILDVVANESSGLVSVKQSMHCVDDVRVGDSPGTLLTDGVCILLGMSARMLRVCCVMFLWARGSITTWTTERNNEADNVLDFVELQYLPTIAPLLSGALKSWKEFYNEPHHQGYCCFCLLSLPCCMTNLPTRGLIMPCLKAENCPQDSFKAMEWCC